eukprot:Tamp_30025.p2 GENE.Tamp_30025~~Tamp_30025.p2  ORF type:complete len:125 (+),score=9.93 Tamp_30025:361-735(+)
MTSRVCWACTLLPRARTRTHACMRAHIQASQAPLSQFIAAAQYEGSKPGFVFKLDARGLGYYEDTFYKNAGSLGTQSERQKVRSDSVIEREVGNFVCSFLVEAFAYGGPEGKQHWGGKAWKDYF